MSRKFQVRNLVYNRATKEDGAVRRMYEANGVSMYELAVPKHGDSWASGRYISDWAEDVLQPFINLHLKSSTSEVPDSSLFG
jgi:hypothetical protein